jgi:hypothetical protein
MTGTPAYSNIVLITVVNRFIVKAPGGFDFILAA